MYKVVFMVCLDRTVYWNVEACFWDSISLQLQYPIGCVRRRGVVGPNGSRCCGLWRASKKPCRASAAGWERRHAVTPFVTGKYHWSGESSAVPCRAVE